MDEDFKITIDRLKNQFNVEDKYIPALMMTAYYESTEDFDAIGYNEDKEGNVVSRDIGYFQINAASFYDDNGDPDPTLTRFFEKNGERRNLTQAEFEEKLFEEKYNTAYAAHIIKDFHEHSKVDPFTKWNAYNDYVKPFLEGNPIPNKSLEEQVAGIRAYVDAYMYLNGLKEIEEFKPFVNHKAKVLDNFISKIKKNND